MSIQTLALSPTGNYSGGGTFFEHMGEDRIVEMEQGQCTFRPGSEAPRGSNSATPSCRQRVRGARSCPSLCFAGVRHGGHKVSAGERYIIGGFLLIADRVEHVRRLQNQGREARGQGDLRRARK